MKVNVLPHESEYLIFITIRKNIISSMLLAMPITVTEGRSTLLQDLSVMKSLPLPLVSEITGLILAGG